MLTLGIGGGFGHDGSACLFRDGQLISYAEEERLTRVKLAYALAPINSILYCVNNAGVSLSEIDAIAFGWDPELDHELPVMRTTMRAVRDAPQLRQLSPDTIRAYPHHSCHAAMAVLASDYSADAVLVMDGRGELASTSIYKSDGLSLELVLSIDVAESLGSFYSSAARFAGFGRGGEGKLMGLAAYGDATADSPMMAFDLTDGGISASAPVKRSPGGPSARHDSVRRAWFAFFEDLIGPARPLNQALDPLDLLPRADELPGAHWPLFARSAQAELERAVLHLWGLAKRMTNAGHLALAGGVALNCAANGLLRRRFPPGPSVHALVGDAGTSIGAAALLLDEAGVRAAPVTHPYLGPGWTDAQIRLALRRMNCSWTEPGDLEETVATRIAEGQTVGWFQGPAEAGPRALGHRSILADPRDTSMAKSVNNLKCREQWRPLAPSVRARDAVPLFGVAESPFMLMASDATASARAFAPAVVHADGTSRIHVPQTHTSPRYRRLLDILAGWTGHGVVLNTSFNVGPEPIVCTPGDAVRSFYASELDCLAIGPALLAKS